MAARGGLFGGRLASLAVAFLVAALLAAPVLAMKSSEIDSIGDATEQSENLKSFFKNLDHDGDGQIESDEVASYIGSSVGGSDFDSPKEIKDGWGMMQDAVDGTDEGQTISRNELQDRLHGLLTAHEVSEWVRYGIKLPQFADAFLQEAVTTEDFPTLLTDPSLLEEELGVTGTLHKQQILRAVKKVILGLGNKPTVPRSLTSAAEDCGRVAVVWNTPLDLGKPPLHSYVLQVRSRGEGGAWGSWRTVAVVPSEEDDDVAYLHEDPGPGEHRYRVAAWNTYGRSEWAAAEVACKPSPANGPGCATRRARLAPRLGREGDADGAKAAVRWTVTIGLLTLGLIVRNLPLARVLLRPWLKTRTGKLVVRALAWLLTHLGLVAPPPLGHPGDAFLDDAGEEAEGDGPRPGLKPALKQSVGFVDQVGGGGGSEGGKHRRTSSAGSLPDGAGAMGPGLNTSWSSGSLDGAGGAGGRPGASMGAVSGMSEGSPMREDGYTSGGGGNGAGAGAGAGVGQSPLRQAQSLKSVGSLSSLQSGWTDDDSCEAPEEALREGLFHMGVGGIEPLPPSPTGLGPVEPPPHVKKSRHQCYAAGCESRWDRWTKIDSIRLKFRKHYCALCQNAFCQRHTRISPHGSKGRCGLESRCYCQICFNLLDPVLQAKLELTNKLPKPVTVESSPAKIARWRWQMVGKAAMWSSKDKASSSHASPKKGGSPLRLFGRASSPGGLSPTKREAEGGRGEGFGGSPPGRAAFGNGKPPRPPQARMSTGTLSSEGRP